MKIKELKNYEWVDDSYQILFLPIINIYNNIICKYLYYIIIY